LQDRPIIREFRLIVFSAANIKIKLQRLGKTVAQVILRWLTQRDIVVIPKSVRKDRMAENFDIFNFELTQEDIEAIRQLDTGTSLFFDHRDPAMVKLLSEAKRNT
jgi:2,5-diketo-D-gluconate reductase A